MKIIRVFLLLMLSIQIGWAQWTIRLTVPDNTPDTDSLFITGDFNSWNLEDSSFQFTKVAPNQYTILCNPGQLNVFYKITRGSIATMEGTVEGYTIPNRYFRYKGKPVTTDLTVDGWVDSSIAHTTTPQVHVVSDSFYIPQLDRYRRISIYLPAGYNSDTIHYPVLYLQDGQNLFDRYLSPSGEWRVDETMDSLALLAGRNCIVVGIDNGGKEKYDEYSPWVIPNVSNGNGEKYAAFIVNTLKPYIDSHFRTLSDRENTGIAGSRFGAILALYAGIEYNAVFSKVGMMSPSLIYMPSDSLHDFVIHFNYKYPAKFYFNYGYWDYGYINTDIRSVNAWLRLARVPEENIVVFEHLDFNRDIQFWSVYYPEMFQWLYWWATNKTRPDLLLTKVNSYPNPTRDKFHINCTVVDKQIQLYDINQRLLAVLKQQSDGSYSIGQFPAGVYMAKGINNETHNTFITKIIKQ